MSSFASIRELHPLALQTIRDGDAPPADGGVDDPRQSVRSSAGSASLRKELASMPTSSAGGARTGDASYGAPTEHQRIGSNGTSGVRSSVVDSIRSARSSGLAPAQQLGRPAPAESTGRASMQASRGAGGLGRQPAPPAIQTDNGYRSIIRDNASINSASAPQRPPKNPRRPADGALNSPSILDLTNGSTNTGLVPPPREFPQDSQYGSSSDYNSPESTGKKSRLRLAFGRKKRESTFGPSAGISNDSKPSIVIAEAQPRASSTFLPSLGMRKSYAGGLDVPKQSFTMERQRVMSSPARESTSLPPRSQSAFGIAPTQRFVSMDIPRRSMNVDRGGNRLSTMPYEQDERYEEDEDDEMEREPGYEAEFERYAQEAEEERYAGARGAAAGRGARARDASFGRKSLNLLREGFKMPLRKG